MSNIALTGNALGTGTLTIASPNTNIDRTLTLPDNVGTLFSTADLATTAEAAAGVSATKLMTPALVTHNRANAARTRFAGNGGNFAVNSTALVGLYGTGSIIAATNMALVCCNFFINTNSVTVIQDVFTRLGIYTAASVPVDYYDMGSTVYASQSGGGAAHSVNITFTTPVIAGASYFAQVDARKSSVSNTVSISALRLDLLFV